MIEITKALLGELLEDEYDLKGMRDWWKDEPRLNYSRDYAWLCDRIVYLEKLYADSKDD